MLKRSGKKVADAVKSDALPFPAITFNVDGSAMNVNLPYTGKKNNFYLYRAKDDCGEAKTTNMSVYLALYEVDGDNPPDGCKVTLEYYWKAKEKKKETAKSPAHSRIKK